MKSRRSALLSLAPATLIAAISGIFPVQASTIYWDGSASTAWATGTNWDGNVAPANDLVTDIAIFDLASYPNQPDAGTTSISGIQIGDGLNATNPLTIGGTALTIGSGGITVNAEAGAATISAPVTLGSSQTWTNNSANALTAGTISRTAGSGTTLKFAGTGAFAAANADTNGMIGGWAVVSTGASTLGWAHNEGATITAATTATLGTSFSGNQGLTNWTNTDGNTTLTAATQVNSFISASDVAISGLLTVNSGGMVLGSNASKWIQNGTGGQITSGLASGELFVHTPNPGSVDMRIRVPLVNNGATPMVLVKDGAGRLDLEATNTYSGATILNQGLLCLRSGAALGSSSGIVVNGNTGITVLTNVNYGGPLTGSGIFNNGAITGNASLSLTGDLSGFTGTFAHTTSNSHNNFNLGGATPASMDASHAKMVLSGNTTQARNVNIGGTGDTVFKLGDLSGAGGKINVNAMKLQVGALGLDSTFAGNISSTGALEKVGAGTLTLSGASSYTGTTTVTGGTLQIGNGNGGSVTAGSAVTVGAAGTLALNPANGSTFANAVTNNGVLSAINEGNITVSGAIGGTGSLQKSGFGTLTLSGTSSYSGPTTISSGGLNVTGNIATSALALGEATLSGNGTAGAVTASAGAVITNGNANTDTLTLGSLAFSAPGTVNLNKSGVAATAALAVSNTLSIGSGFTVNLTTAPSWTSGQTYNLISYGSLSGSAANITKGTIPGLGARQIATLGNTGSANGNITLTISGDTPVWTGLQSGAWTTAAVSGSKNWKLLVNGTATDFVSGDVVVFNDSAAGTTGVNITDGDVQVAGVSFDNSSKNYTISSSGGFGIVDGSLAASLSKSGTGTLTLATVNGYTGATTVNAGTLQLGDGSANGDIAMSAGIVNDGTLVFNRAVDSFIYANPVSGSGAVVKIGTGTQILSSANTYSGSTTISAGTLQLGDGGGTGSLASSAAIINDASLVFDRFNTIAQGTDFGLISGTGSVTQAGSGTLTLSAANTYSGGTLVNVGTVVIGANNPLGTAPVTLAGGALSGSNVANYALTNAVVAQSGTTSLLSTMGKNLDVNGSLSGSGDIIRTATGAAATIYLGGDNSAFTGTFTVDANAAAATRFTAAAAGSAAGKWVINQSFNSRATLDFSGGTIRFGSLTGSGFFTSQSLAVNTIEVGALGLTDTFSGALNQAAGSTLAVTKVGAGTWTLTGTNTYTGDTTVNAGVLAVDGDSLANTGKLVVNGGKVDPSGGVEVVDTLYFGTTQQVTGTWGATGSGAAHIDDTRFTGTGVVSVTSGPSGYSFTSWADANGASGQTMDQDHDGDGVKNGIEYFMGATGSAFTANPAAVGGTITWPMGAAYAGVYGTDYEVQYSTNLVNWTKANEGTGDNTVTVTAGTSVVYDTPTGGKSFVRLVVNN